MDALIAMAAVGGLGLVVWLARRSFQRRLDEVHGFNEREDHGDLLASDISSWPGGRGM